MEFPKKDPDETEDAPHTFRWSKRTMRRLRRVAEVEDESVNGAGEFLMNWALDDWDATQTRKGSGKRSTDPLDKPESVPAPKKKKK